MILKHDKSFFFLLVFLQSCYFDEINQPESVGIHEQIAIEIQITDDIPETNNPHKGILSILVPYDWQFIEGSYVAYEFSGTLNESSAWTDSIEYCYPANSFDPLMKWVSLISDTGYTYEVETTVTISLTFQSGAIEGCFNMAYVTTKATPNLICSGGAFAPLSYPHLVEIGDESDCTLPPFGSPELEWSELFHRFEGWSGADGIYSIPLDGNEVLSDKTLFVFSDTFIGPVDSLTNQRLEPTYLVNNTYAILNGTDPISENINFFYNTDLSGTPISFFIPSTLNSQQGDWYWLMDGISIDGVVHVYALRMNNSIPPFSIDGVALITFEINEENELINVNQNETPLFYEYENGDYVWYGQAIMSQLTSSELPFSNDYIYFYGTYNSSPSNTKYMTVSRVHQNSLEDYENWEFWNGYEWELDIASATQIAQQISTEFSVSQIGLSKYIAIFQQGGISRSVAYRTSNNPTGPFNAFNIIWDAPEYDEFDDIAAYNAKAHPHLSNDNHLLISYNVNTNIGGNFWYHFERGDLYRPRFISIPLNNVFPSELSLTGNRREKQKANIVLSCFPNPFNSSININIDRYLETPFSFTILDIKGKVILEQFLMNSNELGSSFRWDGVGNNGLFVGSGLYFIKLLSKNDQSVKKIILMK